MGKIRFITLFFLLSSYITHFTYVRGEDSLKPRLKTFTNVAKLSTTDELTWTLELLLPVNWNGELPEVGDKIQGLRVVTFDTVPGTPFKNFIKSQKIYKLKADISGTYLLPAVEVKAKNPQGNEETLKTSEVFIEFISPSDNDGKDAGAKGVNSQQEIQTELRDIKDIIKPPLNVKKIILYIGIALAVILITLFLFWKFLWKSKNVPLQPPIAPYTKALNALKDVMQLDLTQEGNLKRAIFEISHLLREYVEGEFNFKATDFTLEEIKRNLNQFKSVDENLRSDLVKQLEGMDLIKFAKYEVNESIVLDTIRVAKNWLEKVQPKRNSNDESGDHSGHENEEMEGSVI